MPNRSRLILVGGVTLVLGLVAFFPARVAYQWMAPPGITLASIKGSVWYGSAGEASASGVYLRDLRWRLRPTKLFSGKLGYAVEARPVSGFVEGNVALGITGSLSASDLAVSMPLQSLQQLMRRPGLGGNLSLRFSDLVVEDGVPVSAVGVLEVANLVLPQVHRFSIGGYRAEFLSRDEGLVASVEDVDGMFDLAGSLQVAPDRSYQFVAQLTPRETAPESVRRQMRFLGSANERGQRELRIEGQL